MAAVRCAIRCVSDQILCSIFYHPTILPLMYAQAEKKDPPTAGKRKSPEKAEDAKDVTEDVTKKQKTPPKDPASVEEEEKKEEDAAEPAAKTVDVPEGKAEAPPPAAEAQ